MRPRWSPARWLLIAVVVASVPFAARFLLRFPWGRTVDAIADADWMLLAAASLMNLVSLAFKGWAWHLLLRAWAPHRWRSAEAGTFVGAAVNAVSISVSGEAVRLERVARRDGVPLVAGAASLVWARIIEALALVVFLAVSLLWLPPGRWTVPAELVAWGIVVVMIVCIRLRVWTWLAERLPSRWRSRLTPAMPAGRLYLLAPLSFSTANWFAQWLTYHWAIAATHVSTSPAVSLVALVAANVGGILRLTPGNVGVLQFSLIFGMEAFHIPTDQALAAGLALQAVQVLPVLLVGVGLVGVEGFRRRSAKRAETVGAI
ncbi:MAG TPA: lysylphosphatidylglycerol synthase transmembrane domain-containing protein [Gemmatimonadales bacterium]|nr:lysylphosphatidylglycerol synthase transmembrane domain-containing protein [Gemmatimonadales bacterium]